MQLFSSPGRTELGGNHTDHQHGYGLAAAVQLDLVAVDDVSRSELLYRLDQIQTFFSQLWVRVVLIVLAVLIVVLLLRWLLFGRRRRYGGARRKTYRGGHYSGRRRRK